MKWYLAFTLVIQLFVACRAGRILVLAPVCSKSHKFSFMPLMEGLAKKGHQVTVVTPFLPSKPVDNIREITTGDIFEEISIDWFEAQRQNNAVAFADILIKFREIMREGYNQLMNNKEFKEILQSRETDLIIVDAILNEFTLPIIDHFNVPFIFYCPAASVPWVVNAMSIPPEYAYVPGGINDNDSRMTFVQRMGNMLSSEVFLWLRQIFLLNMLDDFARKDFPNSRSVAVIERDADLCFINSHPATAWARPLPMNVIPLGATHVRPANTLPEELQLLVDNANQGFIVFTLGSAIPVSSMPKELVEIFVRVFARIPQLVFWKWEKDSIAIELTPNVKIMNWLPQQDLLGHKNARLFMSHGGLLGIQETVYHGVPLLGIPFGNDQRGNLAKAREEGYGLKLDWDTITEETLYSTIQTLLHEPSYVGNASRLSGLMKSQLTSTREVGVYWVEYVLQHGGKHLRSRSSEMPFHQRHLLDVWLILTAASLTFLFITFKLLTCFIKSFKIFKVKTQ